MRKILALTILSLICYTVPSFAATYYVRTDGGTSSQCNGTSDKAYTPVVSDVTKDCSFKHPFWVLAGPGGQNKMVGGDTMIVGPGNYDFGLGAPNANCSQYYPWDCFQNSIPSGTVSIPTRILGKGWDTLTGAKPKFIGIERSDKILSLIGSNNVEIQWIEITDDSECMVFGPAGTACKRTGDGTAQGRWAVRGIVASDSTNVKLKNVHIHGLFAGIHAARLKDWTIEDSDILNNSFVGWDGDMGKTTSSNSGTIKFKNTRIKGSGCGEKLATKTPYSCYSQDQGGYGDALGTEATGGNWVFDGVDISENVSDGVDLLYHNGNGSVTISNSRFERNAGNQVKVGTTTDIKSTTLDGDCAWFNGKAFTSTKDTSGASKAFNNCRAGGDVLAAMFKAGSKVTISNGTQFLNVRNIGIMSGGSSCNGTEVMSVDGTVTFDLKPKYYDPSSTSVKYYASGATGNGDGPCGTLKLTTSGTVPDPICVPNGSCSAATPGCGQTTTGTDNCMKVCTKTGEGCPCVPDGGCTAAEPACGEVTAGVNSCGGACTKTGPSCACVSDITKCNASTPAVGKISKGSDNCGKGCYKTGFVITSYVTPVSTGSK